MTTDNLKSVFRFPFEDEEWLPKLGLLLLFGFGGFLVIPALFTGGYLYEMRRRIIVDKAPPSLPDWENWEDLFLNGLKVMAVSTIYLLPAIVLWCIGYFGPLIVFPAVTMLGNGEESVWLRVRKTISSRQGVE